MWIPNNQSKKWRPDSLEARIHAMAEAEALAHGAERPEEEALNAVFQVMNWLYANKYAVAVDLIKERWGIETSPAALSGFWERFNSRYLSERQRRISEAASAMAGIKRDVISSATLDLIAQQAYEVLSNPGADPGEVVALMKVLLGAQKQSVDERRVALLEAKARQADQAKDVMESQLSEQDKAARMRAIFGM